jgi:hypothetical protein
MRASGRGEGQQGRIGPNGVRALFGLPQIQRNAVTYCVSSSFPMGGSDATVHGAVYGNFAHVAAFRIVCIDTIIMTY